MKRAVLNNLAWLLGERVALTLLVFLSNVYVIRYLGAERFGQLALFQVWLALTITCTEFGLRRVFLALGRARAIRMALSATIRIKLFVGLTLAVAIVTAGLLLPLRPEYFLLLAVALLAPFEAYVYHFEAQLRNDLLARIRIGLALAMAVARVALCLAGHGVPVIAATYVLPSVLLALTCRMLAKRTPGPEAPRATAGREAAVGGHVLHRSSAFFVSVLVLQLHARSDQLLLSSLAGDSELGIYAGAYKFLEQLLLLPAMLSGVLLPALSRRSHADTARNLEQVYFVTFLASIALAVVFSLGARPIVALVLGPGFEASAQILAILAWGIPGLFLANVSGLFYSLNGLERWALVRNLMGLALGVVLGLALIPAHGAAGAAWAMVISYTLVAFGVEWCSARFRHNVLLKLSAFAALFSYRSYGALIERIGRQ